MRVVDYKKNTQSPAYRALWALGVVAGIFSLVVCALMIANSLRLRAADPVHAPALQKLVQDMKGSPQDEALKEQIRELDLLARRAFFTSQHFNQVAIWLLLGGVTVTVIAFKTISTYHRKVPYPDSQDPKEDLAANALWARQSVTTVGLILVGMALSLALPWKSPLDQPQRELAGAPGPAAKKLAPVATGVPAPAAPPLATREVRLKHWPSFRGAAAGHVSASNLPTQWDGKSGAGILWKTAIPLPGFGSPIVWGDRIFLSGGNKQKRAVYAMDARSGKLLWEKSVPTKMAPPGEMPDVTADTGFAAPTMATDGVWVFAIFATGDLAAFDFDGNPVWAQHLGTPDIPYGYGSSLEVFGDMLVVQFDHKGDGFVAALDVRTGATRWKTARKFGPSWASPALIETGGHTELVLVADAFVTSYDPKTGLELWRLKCLGNAEVVPTPVFADGLLFVAAEHIKFAAIDVKTRSIVWENKEETPGIGTPAASGGFLFAGLGESGIACWSAKTGRKLWLHETDDAFYSSPIVAGNRVFLMDRTGRMFIFEANGEGFKLIAQPVLGEEAVTTPAIYGESLIYRGAKHLFRIGT
ncbi:MAG: PQQ-binding-like beta-propeller repeat protein [Limisphaerales bacterium]